LPRIHRGCLADPFSLYSVQSELCEMRVDEGNISSQATSPSPSPWQNMANTHPQNRI
jgi:hypothetical protein